MLAEWDNIVLMTQNEQYENRGEQKIMTKKVGRGDNVEMFPPELSVIEDLGEQTLLAGAGRSSPVKVPLAISIIL